MQGHLRENKPSMMGGLSSLFLGPVSVTNPVEYAAKAQVFGVAW